jgi:hypothetical protein
MGLQALLSAIGSIFGFAKQRDAELNSPAEQANAAAKTESAIEDKVDKDISSPDIDDLRKDVS